MIVTYEIGSETDTLSLAKVLALEREAQRGAAHGTGSLPARLSTIAYYVQEGM